MKKEDCVFCKIIHGDIQTSSKIYEDETIFAFLSNGPVNFGHTLIIPKDHVENVYEAGEDTLARLGVAFKKIATAVKKATNADGINIITNNERAAGQVVFHLHFHVIPRYFNDGFKHWEHTHDYKKGEVEAYAEKIREALS
jgi:histidine triad (HIT) family protein